MKIFKRRDIRPVGGRDLDQIEEEERLYRASVWRTAGIVAASLAFTFVVTTFVVSREPKVDLVNQRVVIAPLENRTGDSKLEALGSVAADWAVQKLQRDWAVQRLQPFQIVPYSTITEYTAIVPQSEKESNYSRALHLARSVGAGIVVWGAYYYDGDSLRFSTQTTDANTGEPVRDPLGRQIDQRIGSWPLVEPHMPSLNAHAAFTQALRFFARGNYEPAAQTFHEAWIADTTFVGARIWEARSLVEARTFEQAGSVLAWTDQRRSRLSVFDRAQLDHITARASYNPDLSYSASSLMTTLAPASDEAARYLAIDALALNNPREARTILSGLDPDHGALRGWPGYYTHLAMAQHMIGNYREELRIARNGKQRFPRDPEIAFTLCRALAALKNRDAAVVAIAQVDLGSPRVRCAEELYAHGERDAATTVASRAIYLYETRRTSFADRLDYPIGFMMLYQNERAYKAMQQMVTLELPAELRSVAQFRLALTAAVAGHRDDAIAYEVAALEKMDDTPYVTLERSRLAAARGQKAEALRLFAEALSSGLPYAESQRALPHAEYRLWIK
ncbi:MAG TPA: hypothetical protein VM100_07035 [Longimicrobiales bacterium]|nr:hypothetical protein [Longimicrobiales bacterium]